MEDVMKSKSVSLAALAFLTLPATYGFAQNRAGSPVVRAEAPLSATQPTPVAARSTGSPQDLLIGAGDLLDVSLYGVPDFKTEVRVNSGGEISLPMLGTVAVGGLSVEQGETLIERKLSQKGLFNNPHVTVFAR